MSKNSFCSSPFGSGGKGGGGVCPVKIFLVVIGIFLVGAAVYFMIKSSRKSSENFISAWTSDLRELPDQRNYEVMAQLPLSLFPIGRGEMNYQNQLKVKKRFPRQHWKMMVPVSRPPDQVSLYDTGLAISPAVENIGVGY